MSVFSKFVVVLLLSSPLLAMEKWQGWCEQGAHKVVTQGLQSAKPFQQSFPNCTATIYSHGVVSPLPLIYLDNLSTPTPEANPITANNDGTYMFYAPNGRYDIVLTGGGLINPVTINDVLLCDPQDPTGAFGCSGGASTPISIQHNGTFVGTEPIVNIIDTASVVATVTNNPGQTRVDVSNASAGGGGGCTPPGTDTGILSEHPVGTCYDSAHATWDDTNFNFQLGFSSLSNPANTVGTDTTYALGFGNNLSGTSQAYAFGQYNDLETGLATSDVYAIGDSNSYESMVLPNSVSVLIGSNTVGDPNHANSGGHDNYAFGEGNSTYNGRWTWTYGLDNSIGVNTLTGITQFAQVVGYNNLMNASQGGGIGGGAGNIVDADILGDFNSIDASSGKTASGVISGFTNHIDTTDGSNAGAFIYGLDNASHGGQSADVVIAGSSNTVHSILNTGTIGASDNFIGGFLNLSHNSGNFVMLGGGNTTNCTVCEVDGFNVINTTNNSIAIGVNGTPELQVTSSTVKHALAGMTNAPVINAFRNSGGTATGTIGQTCNVAFTGGTGSGGTGTLYLEAVNSTSGAIVKVLAGGSYTVKPTGGTLTNGTATCSGSIVATTVIGLVPACSSSTEGSEAALIDSTTAVWGATITGGGANHVLGYCDGTNWTVMAK